MYIHTLFSFQWKYRGQGGYVENQHLFSRVVTRLPDSLFVVDNDRCFGCAACVSLCPVNALVLDDLLAVVDEPSCSHCNYCIPFCPVHALSIEKMS